MCAKGGRLAIELLKMTTCSCSFVLRTTCEGSSSLRTAQERFEWFGFTIFDPNIYEIIDQVAFTYAQALRRTVFCYDRGINIRETNKPPYLPLVAPFTASFWSIQQTHHQLNFGPDPTTDGQNYLCISRLQTFALLLSPGNRETKDRNSGGYQDCMRTSDVIIVNQHRVEIRPSSAPISQWLIVWESSVLKSVSLRR